MGTAILIHIHTATADLIRTLAYLARGHKAHAMLRRPSGTQRIQTPVHAPLQGVTPILSYGIAVVAFLIVETLLSDDTVGGFCTICPIGAKALITGPPSFDLPGDLIFQPNAEAGESLDERNTYLPRKGLLKFTN